MQVDVLRDEAKEFADKLGSAGVRVQYKEFKGHFHNSMIKTEIFGRAAEDTFKEVAAFIHEQTQ